MVDGLAFLGISVAPDPDDLDRAIARTARLGALDPSAPFLGAPLAQVLNGWIVTSALHSVLGARVAELDLPPACAAALGGSAPATLVELLVASETASDPVAALRALLARPDVRRLLGVHDAGGSTWFVKEPFDALVAALLARETLEGREADAARRALAEIEQASGYRLDELLAALEAAADAADEDSLPPTV